MSLRQGRIVQLRLTRVAWIVVVAVAATGCGGPSSRTPTVQPRPLGNDLAVYRPAARDSGRHGPPAFTNPTDSVSLREAVALALLHSPELAASAWETRAREARMIQVGRPPNPTVGALAEDFGVTSVGSTAGGGAAVQRQTTLQLGQLIELGGKRSARIGLAAREKELAEWDYEASRISVLTSVTHAFIDVLVAQEMVAVTRQTATLVDQMQQSVGARVVAGVVSPIEETRAQVSAAAVRVEAERAERFLAAGRSRLASLWGRSDAAFPGVVGDLNRIVTLVPPIENLTARLGQNPDLARWTVEISRRQASLSLERSKRVPDVTLTGGYRQFTDLKTAAYVLGASFSLPLFDRNSGGIGEAQRRLNKAYEERRASEARAFAALAESYRALSSAHREVVVLRETILPGSRQAFEAVSEGYRLGKFGFLDVLDAQRTLISAETQYLRVVSEYHKAVADVERLIGMPLTRSPMPQ